MKRGYFTPPVLIILAIIIFAVAILIAINTDLVKRIKKEPPPTPSPSPTTQQLTTSPDEMTDWKLYKGKDEVSEWQFDYPPDWTNETQPTPGCGPVFWAPNKNQGWITFCTAPGGNTLDIISKTLAIGSNILSKEDTTVDDHVAIKQKLTPRDPTAYHELQVIVKRDATLGKTVSSDVGAMAIYLYADSQSFTSLEKDFDKILSTFQFID